MKRSLSFLSGIKRKLFKASYHLIGSFAWDSPPWLKRFLRTIRSYGILGWVTTVVIIAMMAAGFYWFIAQDRQLVSLKVTAPTDIRGNLFVSFQDNKGNELTTLSAAPIEHFDRTIESGVTLAPPLLGQWRWHGENFLAFTPFEDWSAGQHYEIAFTKTAFDSNVQIKSYRHDFSTLPFRIDIGNLRLYQDPISPEILKIVATLDFNYPIEETSLKEHVLLIMQEVKNGKLNLSAEQIPLTVKFEEDLRRAYIESAPLTLPSVPRFVNLMIHPGVKSVKGPSKSKTIVSKLLMPDSRTFLQIKDVSATIQTNHEGDPEQILEVQTSIGVNSKELSNYLKAYLLPKDYPPTSFQPIRKNYSWNKPGEVNQEVLTQSTRIELIPYPEELQMPVLHRFKLAALTPSAMYIEIPKGLAGVGGFVLTNDYKTVVNTPACPQEIHFLHEGSLMAKSSEKKIVLAVRGIPEIKFTVCRIFPHQINHLVTQTHGDFQNPQFQQENFGYEAISELFTESRQFHMTNPCNLNYTAFDLEPYLAKDLLGVGLFLLKAEGWDGKNKVATGVEKERLILITDMSIIVKDMPDGSHDLFVHSIEEGKPVASAEIVLLGKNSLPLLTLATDVDGHAAFPNLNDFNKDRQPAVYLVRKGTDLSFIPYNKPDRELNYSRFDTDGSIASSDALKAFVFFDRGIYRPGDQIHIGVIFKKRFVETPTAGIPLEIVLSDPQGTKLFRQRIPLPTTHFFAVDYSLPSHALTGNYNVDVSFLKDNDDEDLLGYGSLRVEEFLPDRLKIQTELVTNNAYGWIPPHGQKARVRLWNLFGDPAVNHVVKAKMSLFPKKELQFPEFAGYTFIDPLPQLDSKFYLSENLADAFTDEQGQAEFEFNLERLTKGCYQLTFEASGFEGGGGHSVAVETSAIVTPCEFLLGYLSNDSLSFIKQNSTAHVSLIAITPDLQMFSLNNLQAELVKFNMQSVLTRAPDGTYKYQMERERISQYSKSFELPVEGCDYPLPTDQVGDFALTLHAEDGTFLGEILFSVVGDTGFSSQRGELSLKLNQSEYQPGDTIEMQITAPYTGVGLLTIERDMIYAYKWFKTDSQNTLQSISIPADFKGDGYVNVAFIRSWDSDEIYKNPLSYAVCHFNLSTTNKNLAVELDVPEVIRSGETLTIHYSTDQAAKIILCAVDEGILQVDGFQTPDPLAYFFRKSALLVKTSQIADLILPKYKGNRHASATGGDGHIKLLSLNGNPFKRKTEKPVVFWSGILDSIPTAQTVSYQVPDHFNGSLRVSAIAVSPEHAGKAIKNVQVRSDFMIQPNVPSFLSPDDTATVTATITNGLQDDEVQDPIIVTLTTSKELSIIGDSKKTVMIPPGQGRQIAFEIKAEEVLGSAELCISAQQRDKASKMASTLTIRPACVFQTYLTAGCVDTSSKTISISEKLYPEECKREASASTNPLMLAYGLQEYLQNYPYDTTEKLISNAHAQLVMIKQPFFQLDSNQVQRKFKETLQKLRERQLTCGGFSNWQSGFDACKHSTLQAMDFLTEAKASGFGVPSDLFAGGMQFVEEMAKNQVNSLDEARLQAYAIYLLTCNGIVTTNYLNNLQLYLSTHHQNDWRKDLSSVFMATSHKLLQSNSAANLLIGGYRMHQHYAKGDLVANDAQYLMLLVRHFPEMKQKAGSAIVDLSKCLTESRLNTCMAAYTIQALSEFSPTVSEGTLTITQIQSNDTKRTLVSQTPFYQKANFDENAKAIRFENNNKELFFYQLFQGGYNKDMPKTPVKEGSEIFREYRDSKGHTIRSTHLGDSIEAHIKARTLADEAVAYDAAIMDLLPGGFEVDPHSIYSPGCDSIDVREDRIIFYYAQMPASAEICYSLRAVNKGDYIVPPIFMRGLAHPSIRAQGLASRLLVQ